MADMLRQMKTAHFNAHSLMHQNRSTMTGGGFLKKTDKTDKGDNFVEEEIEEGPSRRNFQYYFVFGDSRYYIRIFSRHKMRKKRNRSISKKVCYHLSPMNNYCQT